MEHKRTEILTIKGKAAVVVQDAKTYERMAEIAQYAESLQCIRLALSEEGRKLHEFTVEFEAERDFRR